MAKATKKYDSIIVGAGHAGVEAALAIARAGYQVLVLTMETEAVSRMSCNPAIGGLAKGHIVREIDALGGEMGLAIDATGIQFRMLNKSRGPAVWAPRAQADKKQYSLYMGRALSSEPNVDLKRGEAVGILVRGHKCFGVRSKAGEVFLGETVIISTGTFLQGLIHVGEANYPGGRRDEPPAVGLSDSLRQHGIELMRFKTGTCPRLHKDSIRWHILEEQKGDDPIQPFSFRSGRLNIDQLPCYITHTNPSAHELIIKNLHRSPLFSGRIVGTGPRYCPSIEDKVVKFPEKERHQLYLEPEGRNTESIYVNGLPTSLSADIQEQVVHSIKGLEDAAILLYGYAIEYDCAQPTQLLHSLETRAVENLFFAGQINCTSGYEEAAAQGIMAGLNVIRKLSRKDPFILNRSEAYIGVLIDDLVTKGTNEPYRMFTSRAEFRLLLRQDNADQRLMTYGNEFGLISEDSMSKTRIKRERIAAEIELLKGKKHRNYSLDKILKRPKTSYADLIDNKLHSSELTAEEALAVEMEVKYSGYVSRQISEVKRFKKMEQKCIPRDIDYSALRGISCESREKLRKIRPSSIGQAARIPGISPCDISLLAICIERYHRLNENNVSRETE